jgi:two-component system NarL family sensor kinase
MTYFIIAAVGSFVFLILTISIVYLSAFQNRKKTFYKKELAKAQLEIKEQTLKYIAYELHDNLGQVASLIKINLNMLQLEGKNAEKVEDTKELVRKLITDLKLLSMNLNGDKVAQLGLIRCILNEVELLNKTGEFETLFEQHGPSPGFDGSTTIILYRMVQEILNNIVKHSAAKHIKISLTLVENLFTLEIIDASR